MRLADRWLNEYAAIDDRPASRAVESVLVLLTVTSTVGLLWSLPVPQAFSGSSPALNWGSLFLMAAVVYYFIISINLAVGLLPFVVLVVAAVTWLDSLPAPLWLLCGAGLVVGLLAQSVLRRVEGRPVFLRQLKFLMLGPMWLLAALFRRLRIPY